VFCLYGLNKLALSCELSCGKVEPEPVVSHDPPEFDIPPLLPVPDPLVLSAGTNLPVESI